MTPCTELRLTGSESEGGRVQNPAGALRQPLPQHRTLPTPAPPLPDVNETAERRVRAAARGAAARAGGG